MSVYNILISNIALTSLPGFYRILQKHGIPNASALDLSPGLGENGTPILLSATGSGEQGMRVKIICPSSYDPNNQLIKLQLASSPPLSILYLAGLTPREHEVSVVDEVVQSVDFEEPVDLVAITSATVAVRRAYQIADEFRRRDVKVVMGGIHATSLPNEALEHVDTVVLGEGDEIWPKVLEAAQQGALRRVYQGTRRESLENLPFPRFDLVDRSRYVRFPFRKTPIFPIQTARGCPHLCDFCSVSVFWGRKLRFRPIKDIVAEIRSSQADTFFFTDDNFIAHPRRTRELVEAITPLNIRYICQIDTLAHREPELIRAIGRSGCFLAFVGFESLKTKDLTEVNKFFTNPSHYPELIRLLHKNGINVYASFMIGFEHDSPDTTLATANFLIDQKVSLASFFRLTPYSGTRLYDRLVRDGSLIDKTWWLRTGEIPSLVKYPGNTYTAEELSSLAMRRFFSLPSILKRFFPLPLFKIPLLGRNLFLRNKLKRFKWVTIV
jgi:radical SAM superfamily enzyme YgiQ (UPF0313 family)